MDLHPKKAGVICPFAGLGRAVRLGDQMGLVLTVAFVVLLTAVALVLLDKVRIEPFVGWDNSSDL